MTIMDDYTLYCTDEQSKKSFELGAPIKDGRYVYYIPTTEQMVNWLETKGVSIFLMPICITNNLRSGNPKLLHEVSYLKGYAFSLITNNVYSELSEPSNNGQFRTRKEATLAAIDAALDYLFRNQKT